MVVRQVDGTDNREAEDELSVLGGEQLWRTSDKYGRSRL